MLGRIAACSIVVLVLASPTLFSGETNASTDVDAPTGSVAIATLRHHARDQIRNQAQDRTDDAQKQIKVSALESAEQPIKSTIAVGPANQSPAMTEPFGLNTIPVASGEVLSKWSGVEADTRTESEILSRCRANAELCPTAARKFLAIVSQGRAQTGRARIGIINRAINLSIRPMSDLAQWGVIDRWSAPLVTLTTGRGDCEDYAIAKYVALKEVGVAVEDLRIILVRDRAVGGEHAIVAIRFDGRWIILDNRWLALIEDSQMRRVVPMFVLDQTGVRKFIPTNTADARPALASHEGGASAPGSGSL
jgi:predicted transglutaminase-like cysteine proteinase